jgi:uridine phosphorylase
MVYPKLKGKYSGKPVFTIQDYIAYKKSAGAVPRVIPEAMIFCYSKRLSERISNLHKISEIRGVLGNFGKLYSIGSTKDKVGLLTEFGIGAPATVLHFEELHAWGVKRFVILGTAGAITQKLSVGDVVVCTKSVRDEGTSHHYLKQAKYSFSTKSLTESLFNSLALKLPRNRVFRGPSWTIDAPYMETVEELKCYSAEGVLTVEMEASALFAVGQLRQTQTAAVFVISDLLSKKKWIPRFGSQIVMDNLLKAFECAKDTLASI